MNLDSPVTGIKGVGEELEKKFRILGIETVSQLIGYYPRRYEDYSQIKLIKNIKPGQISIRAYIKQAKGRYGHRGLHVTEAAASDNSGSVRLVWFNQPYREQSIKPNLEYFISGYFELSNRKFSIINPSMELVSEFPVNTARILPIYRETKGLNSKQIRKTLKEILPLIRGLDETLPNWLLKDEKLIHKNKAVEIMHFPQTVADLDSARLRLSFEELFELSLASLLNKQNNQNEKSYKIYFDEKLAKDFVKHLPFKLTDAQRKVVWQIYKDLAGNMPMNRLIEGDVGSGKTVVATMAAIMAIKENFQVTFMAPTEILARQHATTIYNLLKPLKLYENVVLLVGSMKAAEKTKALSAISSGQASFIIGTHALIQDKVSMRNLALVIIDEQHRFGVEQRRKLMAKAGYMPHTLSLTATPIPRSLALTLYGELEVSILSDKPPGRQEVITKIVSPNSKLQLYEKIKKELDMGHQMFVVCPQITTTDKLSSISAEKIYEELSLKHFKNYSGALLHGRMKAEEKNKIMEKFIEGKIDILVTTTVIEVGVDVPNATIMLIEDADRFGLAQIHQLRGRVGRGSSRGYCYLINYSATPSRRLRALETINNGFKLADLDLEIRGPGAIYGTIQHGALDLKVAKLTDINLINAARKAAQKFITRGENVISYKYLNSKISNLRLVTNLN